MYTVLMCICICSALPFFVLTRFFNIIFITTLYNVLLYSTLIRLLVVVLICTTMLCYAMLCCAMLCYAMLCYAMLCYAMLCYAMLCYAMHIKFPGEPSILQWCVTVAKELHIHPPARWGGVHHTDTGGCPVTPLPPPPPGDHPARSDPPAEITFILVSIYKVKHQ